jgi:hypothetical protein
MGVARDFSGGSGIVRFGGGSTAKRRLIGAISNDKGRKSDPAEGPKQTVRIVSNKGGRYDQR